MAVLKAGCLTTSAAVRGMSPNKTKEEEEKEEKGEKATPSKSRFYVLSIDMSERMITSSIQRSVSTIR